MEPKTEECEEGDRQENERGQQIQFVSFSQTELCRQLTDFIAKNAQGNAKTIRLVSINTTVPNGDAQPV